MSLLHRPAFFAAKPIATQALTTSAWASPSSSNALFARRGR
jgi:hypothetical protein